MFRSDVEDLRSKNSGLARVHVAGALEILGDVTMNEYGTRMGVGNDEYKHKNENSMRLERCLIHTYPTPSYTFSRFPGAQAKPPPPLDHSAFLGLSAAWLSNIRITTVNEDTRSSSDAGVLGEEGRPQELERMGNDTK